MHALVFVNATAQLGVISFRGTDLNVSATNPSGLADHCADLLLWEGITYSELPDEVLSTSLCSISLDRELQS